MENTAVLLTAATLIGLAAAVPARAAEVGKAAPLFVADSSTGQIALEDYRGKKNVLLALYFADFTGGLNMAEMKAFQADIAAFERLNTQVLGVSPDDVETHKRFAASLNLTFPLVSDPGGEIRGPVRPGTDRVFHRHAGRRPADRRGDARQPERHRRH